MKISLLISALVILNSCSGGGGGSGSSPQTTNSDPWSSFSVTSESDLPACSGDIISRLYYIETTDEFKVCKSSGWASVSFGGAITSTTSCGKIQGNVSFQYKTSTLSSGHKIIQCYISDNVSGFSNLMIYKNTQNGYQTDACTLVFDLDTASAGFWEFKRNSGVRTITYTDSGSASDGTVITYASSDCVTE